MPFYIMAELTVPDDKTMYNEKAVERDRSLTLRNRQRLFGNKNLLFWYERLFEIQFSGIDDIGGKRILEVGSGTSPLKLFYSNVITSDILELDYLDIVFDCHDIDKCGKIECESLDIIAVTNVLHHLKDPVSFLVKSSLVLKRGGLVIITEPYFSVISKIIYEKVHHEFSSFDITEPRLGNIQGPLKSANLALPHLIFFGDRKWDDPIKELYQGSMSFVRHFSSLSYFLTGGISMKIPIPAPIYRCLFEIDWFVSQLLPKFFSSFFVMRLEKK